MKIINNFLDEKELSIIQTYKDNQPVFKEAKTKNNSIKARHRNLNLGIDNTVKDILFPKIEKFFPNFVVDTGSFLESFVPYTIHVDTNTYHSENVGVTDIKNKKYSMSLMLPLSENFGSQTVFFLITIVKKWTDNRC